MGRPSAVGLMSYAALLDERLDPASRNTLVTLFELVGCEKFSKYPTKNLQQLLSSKPGGLASKSTVSNRLLLLRLTGWLLRFPGGGYQLQKKPLTARQIVEADPKFFQHLNKCLGHYSKALKVQAAKVQSELEEYGSSLRTDTLELLPYSRWPEGLPELIAGEDRKFMIYCLRQFNLETQQQLLEQLVACCKAKNIEQPMAYLHGLANMVKKGFFVYRPPVLA